MSGHGSGAIMPLLATSQNVPVIGTSAGNTNAKPCASAVICTMESGTDACACAEV